MSKSRPVQNVDTEAARSARALRFRKVLSRLAELGFEQVRLAECLQCAPSRVTKWKDGEGSPEGVDLVKIADFLQTSVRYLCDDAMLEDTGDPHPRRADDASPEEAILLGIIRKIGVEEAISRLLNLTNAHQANVAAMSRFTTTAALPPPSHPPASMRQPKK